MKRRLHVFYVFTNAQTSITLSKPEDPFLSLALGKRGSRFRGRRCKHLTHQANLWASPCRRAEGPLLPNVWKLNVHDAASLDLLRNAGCLTSSCAF